MATLDPNNPEDLVEILGYLVEDEIERLGIERVYSLLVETNLMDSSPRGITTVGSQEEINSLLTDFHFSQQVIFDYYEIQED